MIKLTYIIIVTHGNLAKEFILTAELMMGEISDVKTYGVHLGDNIDLLRTQIKEDLSEFKNKDIEVLILTDLFFGTPFNTVISLSEQYHFEHITGINLPTLMEVLTRRNELSAAKLVDEVLSDNQSIINCNKIEF